MKKALLDSSFIITCVKQKIDFFEDLTMLGLRILIPQQVTAEIKKLSSRDENAKLTLKVLENEKESFERLNLEKYGKTTDKKIINFANENRDVLVATLDKDIKQKIENGKIVIRGKKKIEVV
ncbi:hypothetical protein COU59_00395 [Candidatus Pacearchaeota archaeon CG10_big_fil_rev_8_21_14_0_10_34_12]|nr:MAG: hypothetical protein COU59_00395 [Candidatus Pacearchaeota archaeon CG10_big_fil_rev_8_21_14_0_10_34_12]